MTLSRRIFATGLALATLTALNGCGRKGPLEPPPAASVPKPEAKPGDSPAVAPPTVKSTKKRIPIVPPKAPFVLDPIL